MFTLRKPDSYDQTDWAILEAARDIFSRNGFHNANVDQIASRAGSGKGTVYRRFGNKQQLFLTTLYNGYYTYYQKISRLEKIDDFMKRIQQYLALFQEYILEHSDLIRLAAHEQSHVMEGINKDELTPHLQEVNSQFYAFWARVFQQAQEQGNLRDGVDLKVMPLIISNGLRSLMMDRMMTGEVMERSVIEKRMEQYYQLLCCGVFQGIDCSSKTGE